MSIRARIMALVACFALMALVVTGAGTRAFSAGADISEFSELARDPERLKANNRIVQSAQMGQSARFIDNPRPPVIEATPGTEGCPRG